MRARFRVALRRVAIGLVTACLVILPISAHALGFGSIRVKSALNEPLNAEIDLLSATEADLKGLKVGLASREAFARTGIDRPAHLDAIRFSIQHRASGQAYLKLTTKQSVREPFLDFLLEMNWKSGRMLREYTVLLDPPGLTPSQPGVMASPQTLGPETMAKQEQQEKPLLESEEALASESIAAIPDELLEPADEAEEPAVKAEAESIESTPMAAAEPGAEEVITAEDVFTDEKFPLIPLTEYQGDEQMEYAPEEAPAEPAFSETEMAAQDQGLDYGMVKKNDRLWKIAEKLKPADGSVSLFQVMMALLHSNPDAFVKNNVHRLKVGHVLRIDDRALLTSMSRKQAVAEYKVQTEAWEEYRQERAAAIAARAQVERASDVGMAGESPAQAERPAARSGELVLAAPEGETQSSGSGTKAPEVNNEVVILREEIKQAIAEAEGNKNMAFNAKLRDLENELKDLQRSLTVKDDELAVLQQQLSDINKQAAEAAVPVEEVQPEVVEEKSKAKAVEGVAEKADETTEEAGNFFKDNLALVILAIGGVLAAALAGISFMRRRKEAVALQESILSDIPAEGALPSDELSLETNLSGESSFLSDFVVSGAGSDTDVDPLTEADVFIAYGRYEAAEERILEAIKKDPERLELRTKLLELYNTTKNTEAFEAAAEKLYNKIERDPNHSLWQKAVTMGSLLVPENPLFATSTTEETAESAAAEQEETAALDTTESDMEGAPVADSEETTVEEGDMAAATDTDYAETEEEALPDLELDFVEETTAEPSAEAEEITALDVETEEAAGIDVGSELALDAEVEVAEAEVEEVEAAEAEAEAEAEADTTAAEAESPEPDPDSYFNSEVEAEESIDAEAVAAEELEETPSAQAQDETVAEMSVDEELDSIMSNLKLNEQEFSEEEDEMLELNPDFISDLDEDVPLDVSDFSFDSDLSIADLDVGDMDAELDATDVAGLETPPVVDEVGTKLDLAKAYIDMGDPDGARSILDEVLEEGTPPQQQEAQQLMQQI